MSAERNDSQTVNAPFAIPENENWVVLSVEDDADYQMSLFAAIDGMKAHDRRVKMLSASSANEAARILADRNDVAIILLDVVMEDDDAGLRLVDVIRNVIGNNLTRIVLLTGQPGIAPRQKTLESYDINEYWNKVDIDATKLRSIITANLRTWISLNEMHHARRGLQMIVEVSKTLASCQNLNSFSDVVLKEIGEIIGLTDTEGMLCLHHAEQESFESSVVIAATGNFKATQPKTLKHYAQSLSTDEYKKLQSAVNDALTQNEHQFCGNCSVLFFPAKNNHSQSYLLLVKTQKPLLPQHIALLKVFSENVTNGFANLALLNRVSQLAYFDSTMGLPNYNYLVRELSASSKELRANLELVIIEIDDYSSIELSLGQSFLERLVLGVVDVIKSHFPNIRMICQTEDDTFALLFNATKAPGIQELSLLTEMTVPLHNLDHTVSTTIAQLPLNLVMGKTPVQVLTIADIALQKAKATKQSLFTYTPDIIDDVEKRFHVLNLLHQAIDQKQGLYLEFQPKVNMYSGEAVGFEALLRWKLPSGGGYSPGEFIPIAETAGIIPKLDMLVMEQTFAAIQVLYEKGYQLPVSFNATYADITHPPFVTALEKHIDDAAFPASMVEIEITETQAMQDYNGVFSILKPFIDEGMLISIDDFGTGYSSLAHLVHLPASTLKVDRRFVRGLSGEHVQQSKDILAMVYNLTQRLSLKLIVEGVETEQEKDVLLSKGYLNAQGFLFARPMPLDKLITWLSER